MGKTTILNVAETANVSASTASRVLRGEGYASSETRERVLDAARQLGYSVNLAAQSLRTHQTYILALVLPTVYHNPFYSAIAHFAGQFASESGYALVHCTTDCKSTTEADHLDRLVRYRSAGIMIVHPTDLRNLEILERAGIRYCLIERPAEKISELGGVLIDHRYGVEQSVDHLICLGHRRISFLGIRPNEQIERDRIEGYRYAMTRAGLAVNEDRIYLADQYTRESGRQLVSQAIKAAEPPTAIFVASDNMAIGALQELYAQRMRVPDDISVVNFEDSWGGNTVPPLTCVHMPIEEVAKTAVELLVNQPGHTRSNPLPCRMVQPRLVIRESTRSI